MGHYAKVPTDSGILTDYDAATLAEDVAVLNIIPSAPISGSLLRNGRQIAFTLETTNMRPESHHLLPEQVMIAALVLVSFVPLILHLVG